MALGFCGFQHGLAEIVQGHWFRDFGFGVSTGHGLGLKASGFGVLCRRLGVLVFAV